MQKVFRLKKWLEYQWSAKTKYYLHSPFVYQFYLNVLEGDADENLLAIEDLRRKLKTDNREIAINDLGTGSHAVRPITELESIVAIRPKYGWLLYRLVKYFKPATILELGSSIGLSSAYMALANKTAGIITVEGAPEVAAIAQTNHQTLGIGNIEVVSGNFDNRLKDIVNGLDKLDLVFFDGNHRKEATLQYFETCLTKANENSIFIFDDIYYSAEMAEAWEIIKQHPKIKLTMDIYQLGICFFIPQKLAKEDFVLRY